MVAPAHVEDEPATQPQPTDLTGSPSSTGAAGSRRTVPPWDCTIISATAAGVPRLPSIWNVMFGFVPPGGCVVSRLSGRAGGEHALERVERPVAVAEPRPHQRRPRAAPGAIGRAVGQPMLERLGDRSDDCRIAVGNQLVVREGAEQVGEVAVPRLPLDDLLAHSISRPSLPIFGGGKQRSGRGDHVVEPRIVEAAAAAAASTQRSKRARVICTSIAGFRHSATRTPSTT